MQLNPYEVKEKLPVVDTSEYELIYQKPKTYL